MRRSGILECVIGLEVVESYRICLLAIFGFAPFARISDILLDFFLAEPLPLLQDKEELTRPGLEGSNI
jgi:hypothetical protein